MANQIKLKRGSGSDPGASDLDIGEIAIRTDNGKLFTKRDNGNVTEITGGGGIDDGDKGDVTVSNSGQTFTIDNNAVTLAKMQNVITDTILGRTTNGTGDLEVLSAASVRGIINVEDGATADQSASEILTLIKTVDGAGSGLDADLLDGISSSSFLRSDTNTLLNGILTVGGSSVSGGEGGEIRITYAPNGSLSGSNAVVDINNNNFRIFEDGGNNRGVFIDLSTCSNSASGKLYHNGNDGAGSGLDADLLDGQEGSYYRNASNINAGTLSSSRLPATISADTNGNAATATQLSSAVTIAGVSFDGSQNIDLPGVNTTGNQDTTGNASTATALAASVNINGNAFDGSQSIDISYNDLTNLPTIPTNNNQLTNGAGYTTFDGDYNSLSNLPTIPTNNNQLANGAGYSTFSGSYNDLSNKPTIPTNNNQLTNGAGYITSASAGIPASGGTFTGDIGVSGGAGALTVNAGSDIRFTNGNWTGNHYGKIQHHGNALYISGGSSGDYSFIFRHNANDRVYIKSNGTIWPTYNNSADLGLSNRRWANIYVQDMHFSNGEDNPNKVDGTWGDWTLQEGEDNVYMLNNRNGKKYKMNLTEIV
tara:strand:+ start:6192 stop:7973 length:1782 start_codon:yes stop_codon:yes gene_type:complete